MTMARRTPAWAPEEPRAERFIDSARLPKAVCMAGRVPESRATATAMAPANASTRQSRITAAVKGRDSDSSGAATRISRSATADAGYPSQKAKHQAFGQQLCDQAAAAGAQRGPHRQFPPACGALGEQQIGDVGASDQQHQCDGAECYRERALQSGAHQHPGERLHRDGRFAIFAGCTLGQGSVNALHLLPGLGERSAGA